MNLEQLIFEAKKGNKLAEDELFNRLSDNCLSLCLRYVKNEADAEERMLDGFFHFFESLKNFNYVSDAAVYGWLRKIMYNECMTQLRKRNVFHNVGEPAETDAVLDEEALEKLSATEIHKMICILAPGARSVFNLFAIEELSQNEIAENLGVTVGTVKKQLGRARACLQQQLSFFKKKP